MFSKIKHNKQRNTGLIYEALLKQTAVDLLTHKEKKSPALEIIKQYFNRNSFLNEELSLYNIILTTHIPKQEHATTLLEEVIKARCKLDLKKLYSEKYRIIREIKEHYDINSFFKIRIPKYKEYASVYKLFEMAANILENYNPSDIVQSRITILEHITSPTITIETLDNPSIQLFKEQSTDIKQLSYQLLIAKFNEKYQKILSEEQKEILRDYVYNLNNPQQYTKILKERVEKLISYFNTIPKTDKVLSIKLEEIKKHLPKIYESRDINKHTVILLSLSELKLELEKLLK